MSGIAFGMLNGAGVIAISASICKDVATTKVYTYQFVDGALTEVGTDGKEWGDNRCATSIAGCTMHGTSMLAYGRNARNHARVVLGVG